MKLLNRGTLFLSLIAGIVLIIISLVFTWSFFYSLSTGFLAFCFAIFGVVNDFGKVIFLPAVIVAASQNKRGHAFFFSVIWTICFVISLVASQSFDLNQKNDIKNKNLIESSSYKRQAEIFETTKDSIVNLKNDIVNLKKNRVDDEKRIRENYAPRIETARKLNMLTINPESVAEISKRRDKEIKDLDVVIEMKQKQLLEKESALSSINNQFADVGKKVEHTEGLLSFSHWLAGIFGGNPDNLIGWFYILKNVFSEFLALGLLLLGGMELEQKSTKLLPTSPDDKPRKKSTDMDDQPTEKSTKLDEPKFKPQLSLVKSKEQEFNQLVKLYIDNMEDPNQPGTCLGYQKIGKKIGVSSYQASKIKGHLENLGIIKVVDGQTIITNKKAKLA
jgi:hypothetical protein